MDQKLIVLCGDAVEEMEKLSDKSIHLITADPPYNLNKDYGNYRDNLKGRVFKDIITRSY